jgi:hypothetical protein
MRGAKLIVLTLLFACAALYFAFGILLTISESKNEAAGQSFLFHGAGLVASIALLIWGIIMLVRGSRG